jgi:5-methylcytosine-specific restriction endonuclease McrA
MNSILKRKFNDTLHLNNIYKKIKSSIHTKNSKKINTPSELLSNYSNTKQNNHNNNRHIKYLQHNFNSSRKEKIPKRIREIVWTTYNGEQYSSKCYVSWCNNIINVFNYQVGHDIPESKGGTLEISNLKPICGNCNLSMGNKYTITEWNTLITSTTTTTTNTNTTNTNTNTNTETINNKKQSIIIKPYETIQDPKDIIQSNINIIKTKFNNSKTITKSLDKIENILEKQKNNNTNENTDINNNEYLTKNKPNKFVVIAMLMVIIHILTF